eukprot:TRINITY_DN2890_c1_g1::TRINITY_DN2890_c1_g1_i1::g.5816::m.5816 TRINITY_DN2890_c1_g1::TRINITY_DN2890_c1_g1_i1::g.5816  ORF type:complete len:242 (-),score=20.71,MFS_1/PF07690.11/0.0086,7tm_1/PF00001.16/3.5e+02,7tm_1/PF00001.16/0.044,PBP_GOBP/PF01395.17/0.14,DUF2157/PF09925.4/2.3e+03,DUF2157/PF09925.4/0.23 TRINITY_DN2890_c1_g1_i1:226-951(-)
MLCSYHVQYLFTWILLLVTMFCSYGLLFITILQYTDDGYPIKTKSDLDSDTFESGWEQKNSGLRFGLSCISIVLTMVHGLCLMKRWIKRWIFNLIVGVYISCAVFALIALLYDTSDLEDARDHVPECEHDRSETDPCTQSQYYITCILDAVTIFTHVIVGLLTFVQNTPGRLLSILARSNKVQDLQQYGRGGVELAPPGGNANVPPVDIPRPGPDDVQATTGSAREEIKRGVMHHLDADQP